MNTIEEIIQNKSWDNLSSFEKEQIQELASNEREFNEMRSFFASMKQISREQTEVGSAVKQSLDALFQAKHGTITISTVQQTTNRLFNWKNAIKIAAVLLLSIGIVTMWVNIDLNNKVKEVELTASKSVNNKQKNDIKPSIKNKESNNVEINVRPLNPILRTVPDSDDMIQQSTPSVGLIASSSSSDYLDYGRDADLNPSSTTADVELKADDVLDLLVTSF